MMISSEPAVLFRPVRSAFQRLAAEGLVILRPHRGAVVSGLDLDDMREVFEMRSALEGLAIRLATEMGGDTDTIACLAAGLCTMYAGQHNLPAEMVKLVSDANHLDFDALAELVVSMRASWKGENA